MAGNVDRSIELFAAADKVAHDYEGKALISASGAAGQVGAALTNDTTLPWEGTCHDKVMSRTLNAMNYLAKQDLEGARVEVKKAEEYQIMEREKRKKAVAKAAKKDVLATPATPAEAPPASPLRRQLAQQGNATPPAPAVSEAPPTDEPAKMAAVVQPQEEPAAEPEPLANPAMNAKYEKMYSFARNLRNSYENAFTYYLSSQIYRAQGASGLNDALVDIKRAYALAPQVPAIQNAYLDLATQAQDAAALEHLKANLVVAPGFKPSDPASTGTVVVIFEAGLVPMMSEVSINLPLSDKLFTMAFPIYNDFGASQPVLQIQTPTGAQTTSKVVDLRLLVVKSLQERMPEIVARGTLGAVAKIAAQKEIKDNFGFFAGLAAAVATKAVTSADLRSWLSLPAEVQTAQFTLQPGATELTLSSYDWAEKVALDVAPGTYTFLMIKAIPGFKSIKAASVKIGA